MRKAQLCKGPFLPRADLEPHWIPHSRLRLDPPDPGEHCHPPPPHPRPCSVLRTGLAPQKGSQHLRPGPSWPSKFLPGYPRWFREAHRAGGFDATGACEISGDLLGLFPAASRFSGVGSARDYSLGIWVGQSFPDLKPGGGGGKVSGWLPGEPRGTPLPSPPRHQGLMAVAATAAFAWKKSLNTLAGW